jgi:thymidylate kinase
MIFPESGKPYLIVLEGPAGVGKTTLQHFLWQAFIANGIKASLLPEFSDSPLGEALRSNTNYGQPKPSWVLSAGGVLAFLADKLYLLEAAARNPSDVWIADRFITSQLILGLSGIETEQDRELMRQIIMLIFQLIDEHFSDGSCLVFMEAPLDVLKQRLQKRTGQLLSQAQMLLLEEEIRQYAHLTFPWNKWNQFHLNSSAPLESLAKQLISAISSQWTK